MKSTQLSEKGCGRGYWKIDPIRTIRSNLRHSPRAPWRPDGRGDVKRPIGASDIGDIGDAGDGSGLLPIRRGLDRMPRAAEVLSRQQALALQRLGCQHAAGKKPSEGRQKVIRRPPGGHQEAFRRNSGGTPEELSSIAERSTPF